MKTELKIYLDKMQNGQTERIDVLSSPAFIGIDECHLKFESPVSIKGKAYLTQDHLVMRLGAHTTSRIPCSICNKNIDIEVWVPEFCHTEGLQEIKCKVYDYANLIREAILLEVPTYVECYKKCSKRAELNHYTCSRKTGEQAQFPFRDLKEMHRVCMCLFGIDCVTV